MPTESDAYELRRAIEEILDDASLPRYLQVSRIVELLEGYMVVKIMEIPTRATPPRKRKKDKAPGSAAETED